MLSGKNKGRESAGISPSANPEPSTQGSVATQKALAVLSPAQINVKLAKLTGWKFVNGSWWHDDYGDGPPIDFCAVLGRPQAEQWIAGIMRENRETELFQEMKRRMMRALEELPWFPSTQFPIRRESEFHAVRHNGLGVANERH